MNASRLENQHQDSSKNVQNRPTEEIMAKLAFYMNEYNKKSKKRVVNIFGCVIFVSCMLIPIIHKFI